MPPDDTRDPRDVAAAMSKYLREMLGKKHVGDKREDCSAEIERALEVNNPSPPGQRWIAWPDSQNPAVYRFHRFSMN